MCIYMSFKLCIYVFWAHGGEFFDMNTVTKGTLFAIFYDLHRKSMMWIETLSETNS